MLFPPVALSRAKDTLFYLVFGTLLWAVAYVVAGSQGGFQQRNRELKITGTA